ncbi:MAG: phosphoadenylyl-sulfate reductase [Actinomycetota bacterium]
MNLAQLNRVAPTIDLDAFERAHPHEILAWTAKTVDRLAIATSFQSSGLVMLHMLQSIRRDLPVLFLDTGFHFDETIAFKNRIVDMWDLNIVDLRGKHGSVREQNLTYGFELYRSDPDKCCFINKVEPLQRALEEFDGWISGLRRDQSQLRAGTPIIEDQQLVSGREVLKLHPLANWTKTDVNRYIEEHDIPTHPLLELGFASIGCAPCTSATGASESDERAGRWQGSDKTECGIHNIGKSGRSRQSEAEQ